MRKISLLLFSIAVISASVLSVAPSVADAKSGVTISQAWVRSSSYSDHVGGMTGVFASITNRTAHAITLLGGNTNVASTVQTHQVVNGLMSQKSGGFKIAKGATLVLQPGGLHLMLMGLNRPILAGDSIVFTFKFMGAQARTLKLIAKPVVAGGEVYSPSPIPSTGN